MTATGRPYDAHDLLKRARLLRLMEPSALSDLADRSRIVRIDRDERLVSEGDPLSSLPFVGAGRLRMAHIDADGRQLAIGSAGPGECIGAAEALSSSRARGDIFALELSVVVLAPVRVVDRAMRDDPAFARSVAIGLADLHVRSTDALKGFTLDAPARLAAEMFRLALASGPSGAASPSFRLPTTKGQLAAELGLAPESLSRAFARLREEGLLTTSGRDVVVHDLKGLASLGSGYTRAR